MSCSAEQLQSIEDVGGTFYTVIAIWNIEACIVTFTTNMFLRKMVNNSELKDNVKKLFGFLFYNTIIYTVSYVIPEFYQFLHRFFPSGCDLLVFVKYCVLFRIIQSFSTFFLLTFHIGALMEIVLGNSWPRYKTHPYIVGFSMILFSISGVVYSLFEDLWSHELQVKCSSLEHKSKLFQLLLFSSFLLINLVLLSLHISWSIYQWRRRSDANFHLSFTKKQALKEINSQLKLMWKNVLLIIIAFTWFAGSSLYFVIFDNITASTFLLSYSIPTAYMLNSFIWLYQVYKLNQGPVVKPFKPLQPQAPPSNQPVFWLRVKFFFKLQNTYTVPAAANPNVARQAPMQLAVVQ